jgi:AcrR family transcriptional regulator
VTTADRSGSGDLARTLQLLWQPEPVPERGPRRSLSVATIVDAAIDIADERGLEAVSIRSVASRLGVGTMTLYRYIPSKAELLDLMLDRMNGPPPDALPTPWRPAMEAVAHQLWLLYTDHRWLPFVDQTRPVLGPNAVRALELVMEALADSGLTDREKVALTVTIEGFVASLARTENSAVTAQLRTGTTHQDFWAAQEATLVTAMETGEYPHMAALGEEAFSDTTADVLQRGIAMILDGVQALLDRRASGST